MAVGKTTVGLRLARRLGWPFVDLDEQLTARFGAITDQWMTIGEQAFRLRECALLRQYCDGQRRVLATGGGTWVSAENRAMLAGSYERCVLTASVETIRIRIAGSSQRPLAGQWEVRLNERQEFYKDADFSVLSEDPPDVVAAAIEAHLQRRGLV